MARDIDQRLRQLVWRGVPCPYLHETGFNGRPVLRPSYRYHQLGCCSLVGGAPIVGPDVQPSAQRRVPALPDLGCRRRFGVTGACRSRRSRRRLGSACQRHLLQGGKTYFGSRPREMSPVRASWSAFSGRWMVLGGQCPSRLSRHGRTDVLVVNGHTQLAGHGNGSESNLVHQGMDCVRDRPESGCGRRNCARRHRGGLLVHLAVVR